jgi:hypothetical protein
MEPRFSSTGGGQVINFWLNFGGSPGELVWLNEADA